MEEYVEKYKKWCQDPNFDEETKKELLSIKDNPEEIQDRFYKELAFGTAGLRGVMGNGTNRMNKYTVTKATQALANYIIKQNAQDRGVVIAYDSRNNSKTFSEEAALCLNANGIKTYLFDELRPTPELSFAVRELNCISGIVVTASHNPPKYNGYKVYWEDGAQIIDPKDKEIIEEANSITDFATIKTMNKQEAIEKGLYHIIGKELDDKYIEQLKKQVLNNTEIQKEKEQLKIVYTPLHGTGTKLVKRILTELGFKNLYVVPEQEQPDGNFPTVHYPNPEDPKAFEMALELAKKVEADIILANDPDADRIGMYVRESKTGEYIFFTGNMLGLVMLEYLLSQRKEKKLLSQDTVIIKSIVSSNMTESITQAYHVELMKVLTGFKHIGAKIREFEQTGEKQFLFSYEESYGCLVGTHARDKDGIVSVMTLCEAAAYYKKQGLTLWDQMLKMYEKYGYYQEGIYTITLEGVEGEQKIKSMVENFRNNPINHIGTAKVEKIRDYQTNKVTNMQTKESQSANLPKSNVLYYELTNNEWCAVRPSGTEPKIKFYMGVTGKSLKDAEERLEQLKNAIIEMAKNS